MSAYTSFLISDLIAANRWDDGFDEGRQFLRHKISYLKGRFTVDQVRDRVAAMPELDLASLGRLLCHPDYAPTSVEVLAATQLYPYLSLVFMEGASEATIQRLYEQAQIDDAHRMAILGLEKTGPLERQFNANRPSIGGF